MFYNALKMPTLSSDWEKFKISYKSELKAPVSISVREDSIVFNVHIKFHKNMLRPYENKDPNYCDSFLKNKEDGYTFADAAVEAINEHWGKSYTIKGFENPVRVVINVIRYDDKDAVFEKGQRFFKIKLSNFSDTSFVASSPWRWLWGMPFYLCPESVMLNWSPYEPGTIHMHKYMSLKYFKKVIAHEFGHVLGIGDAYGAHYRFYYEAPNTSTYMMNNNLNVNPEELMMVLRAHETKRMQYFPIKLSLKNYINGLKKDFKYYFKLFNKSHKNNN